MSLETRSLVLPGEMGYHSTYGSIQAGHNKDDNSDMDDDDTRRPLYNRSSVVSVSSFSELFEKELNRRRAEENDRSGSDDEDAAPPHQTIYRRSCEDKPKLTLLAPLYFLLMVIAAVIAFYSIESVIVSISIESAQSSTSQWRRTTPLASLCSHKTLPNSIIVCEEEVKARMGLVECVNHNLVEPYHHLRETR
ncbi:uncharacterized protein LOC135333946 isoform X2 [Halichondria panicea]|uniref:uncharacterized protein LOC135333946 isoform X2 n=1 Tax=Halichondria panicea TaxID=6063 RepID=UPI00312B84C1